MTDRTEATCGQKQCRDYVQWAEAQLEADGKAVEKLESELAAVREKAAYWEAHAAETANLLKVAHEEAERQLVAVREELMALKNL